MKNGCDLRLCAGESSWEHPFDEDYRDLAERVRGAVSAASGAPAPKEKDVVEMAGYLGIDPATEPRLLWIASQASVAPLPEGWAELEDDQGGVYYYDAVADASTRRGSRRPSINILVFILYSTGEIFLVFLFRGGKPASCELLFFQVRQDRQECAW